jgi:hypothetical protein
VFDNGDGDDGDDCWICEEMCREPGGGVGVALLVLFVAMMGIRVVVVTVVGLLKL